MKSKMMRILWVAVLSCCALVFSQPVFAQGTAADYERANSLKAKYEAAAIDISGAATWIGNTHRFWYRKLSRGVYEYIIFDADTLQKKTAFDHAKIAAALAKLGSQQKENDLQLGALRFDNDAKTFNATVDGTPVRCVIADSTCAKVDPPNQQNRARPQGPFPSPDGKWEASINNYNVVIRATNGRTGGQGDVQDARAMAHAQDARTTPVLQSTDGSEGNYYEPRSLVWSPDSTRLAVYRVRPGYKREVHYVESSPEDQIQPKFSSIVYAKPGDVLDLEQPVLFDVVARKQINIDNSLFPNPYELTDPAWRKHSRAFFFEYNQRGHQVYRVIEVDAGTGKARAVISDEPKTFFSYRPANGSLADSGHRYRYDVNDGREIIWMSERDGWAHLYLYDGASGTVKNQITKGEWVTRAVQRVDEAKRQIWFSAGGMYPGKDPYFAYYYRINFDGTGLTRLTDAEANHNGAYSTDGQFFVDNYSRVDAAPILELRKTADNSVVTTVEKGDLTELAKTTWRAPEVFTAKGRDGLTDIWGVIIRPTNFDAKKKYPVIENIYAGPQGSFVPKSFLTYSSMMAQADIGFIVVQIDGMGTANRSKAFHDVAWQNLGDAGFPDRILWHKAVAAKYPWYDITRVGIYGGSAGGQNALGGLLFHPEFYKAAVSYAGCHDNRMDKIWWNEQWMGWPIGPQYSASSNVDNAYRLQGDLLLVVGEMDTNVDPSSTMQVVHQLLKHNKDFDLLVVPGANHPAARGDQYAAYGDHKRFDFFVRHLLGVTPPVWNGKVVMSNE
jgi:dipeptidyl aminopeptidase/acylaminoacyl peptidase